MGSSRESKSTRVKSARPGERLRTRQIRSKPQNRAPAEVLEIPAGVLVEIESQRGVLVTVITILHCLHVALEHRQDHIEEGLDPRVEAGVRWVSLPEMTATILELTHAVLTALDSSNLTMALKAVEP
jgi:hypothetical protein